VATELTLSVTAWILTARHVGRVPVPSLSWRIILAGLVMAVAVEPLSNLGGIRIVIPIAVGIAVYAAAVLLLRVLNADEIRWARRALAFAR